MICSANCVDVASLKGSSVLREYLNRRSLISRESHQLQASPQQTNEKPFEACIPLNHCPKLSMDASLRPRDRFVISEPSSCSFNPRRRYNGEICNAMTDLRVQAPREGTSTSLRRG